MPWEIQLAANSRTLFNTLEPELYNADALLAKASSEEIQLACGRCLKEHVVYAYRRGGAIIRAILHDKSQVLRKLVSASLRAWPEYLSAGCWDTNPPVVPKTPLWSIRIGAFDTAEMLERAGSDLGRNPTPAMALAIKAFLCGHADLAARMARDSQCIQRDRR